MAGIRPGTWAAAAETLTASAAAATSSSVTACSRGQASSLIVDLQRLRRSTSPWARCLDPTPKGGRGRGPSPAVSVADAGYSQSVTHAERRESLMTIRSWMTRRGTAFVLVAVIALVTFAVPAWCVASGTWSW